MGLGSEVTWERMALDRLAWEAPDGGLTLGVTAGVPRRAAEAGDEGSSGGAVEQFRKRLAALQPTSPAERPRGWRFDAASQEWRARDRKQPEVRAPFASYCHYLCNNSNVKSS